MSHLEEVQREFTRQASEMARSPAFLRCASVAEFRRALGVSSAGRVLEVGRGPGLLAAELVSHAREYVGFDATRAMLQQAASRRESLDAPLHLVRGPAETLPFPYAAFDAALTRLTLHHLPTPRAVLHELHRVLRPGGRLLLADIVSDPDPHRARLHNALELLRDPSHVRMLSADELDATLRSTGFTLDDVRS